MRGKLMDSDWSSWHFSMCCTVVRRTDIVWNVYHPQYCLRIPLPITALTMQRVVRTQFFVFLPPPPPPPPPPPELSPGCERIRRDRREAILKTCLLHPCALRTNKVDYFNAMSLAKLEYHHLMVGEMEKEIITRKHVSDFWTIWLIWMSFERCMFGWLPDVCDKNLNVGLLFVLSCFFVCF